MSSSEEVEDKENGKATETGTGWTRDVTVIARKKSDDDTEESVGPSALEGATSGETSQSKAAQPTDEMRRDSTSSFDSAGSDDRHMMEQFENLEATINAMINGEPVRFDDDDDDDFELDDLVEVGYPGELPQSLYPMGPLKYVPCIVCFEKKDLNLRTCCTAAVCDACVLMYIHVQVEQGIVKIACPNDQCDQYVHRDEVMTRLTGEVKDKYYRFLTDANKDPHIKTCPRCSAITKIEPSKLRQRNIKKYGLRHRCEECELTWCFPCQAPWHEGITCKGFSRGDKMVRKWAKEQYRGQVNAQKCPKCKIFIQRSSGCDHMTCNRCKVHFCYRCGERHIRVKFLGDHYSRLSIFGCKYKFLPEQPVRRKFIRGSIFALKALLAPVVAAFAIGACACCLGIAVFVLPFWGIHKLRKRSKAKKRQKEERQYRDMWRQRLQEIRVQGDPYIANFNRMRDLGQNPYQGSQRSNRNTQVNNGTLLVDELDMRIRNSTLSSFTSDNQSVRSLSEGNVQFIELNMGDLDIHNSNPIDADVEVGTSSSSRGNVSSGVVLCAENLLASKNGKLPGQKNTKDKGGEFDSDLEVRATNEQKVTGCERECQNEAANEMTAEIGGIHSCDGPHKQKVPPKNNNVKTELSDDLAVSDNHRSNRNFGGETCSPPEGEILSISSNKAKKEMTKGEGGNGKVVQKGMNKQGDSKVKRLVSQYSCSLRSNDDDDEGVMEVIDRDILEECSISSAVVPNHSKSSKKDSLKFVNDNAKVVNGVVASTKVKDGHNVLDTPHEKEVVDYKDVPEKLAMPMNDSGVYV